ncbi:Matrix metalloproteinase-19 [Orchesella cincta]|uniref:Matrix metalloproteinase-19 n=1 Tax=Orchesella cincta TaxID=48709 RepID=A0A1D2MTL2_ORCCI|nr:Matrix metalloproteinase-19 [Orchesella cincta]
MVKGAIMQPFYGGYSPKLQLHADDIAGVVSMYGKREVRAHKPAPPTSTTTGRPYQRVTHRTETPSTPKTTRRPNTQSTKSEGVRPDLCKDASVDAITTLPDGTIYAFKGSYVFQIDGKGKGVIPGWPHRIESIFKGLEGNLDAAVTRKNGKTYFFKGSYYWRFQGTKMDPWYPKKISMHFEGLPDNIDSSFEWIGALYFTKGDKIWRFDPKSKPHVSEKYPVSLQVWNLGENVPRIDASFRAPNGHTYFFYDQSYWRFNERTFRVKIFLNEQ